MTTLCEYCYNPYFYSRRMRSYLASVADKHMDMVKIHG